ncbi:MAG: hypothetical protein ABJC74_12860 [Gemmatimonadota bacterium]
MHSPTDRARRWLETAFRLLALAALLSAIGLALRGRAADRAESSDSNGLPAALRRWSTVTTPIEASVAFLATPTGRTRDWLTALAGAGSRISWSGSELVASALSIEPRADPAGGADLVATAPLGASIVFIDAIGTLDSARVSGSPVRLGLDRPRSTIEARVGAVTARAGLTDSLSVDRLLVIGRAGWELKFTMAALEERGWQVDAVVQLSPASRIGQGITEPIDTARYAAVVTIDSSAGRYAARIARYVHSGGGLVAWPEALLLKPLARLAPGQSGAPIRSDDLPPPDSLPRTALTLLPITALRQDAVILERRGQLVAVAARRIGAGRVLQTGYTNAWRWRMAGGAQSVDRHRAWISALVSRVAYSHDHPLAVPPADAAPLATLVAALGRSTPPAAPMPGADPWALLPWLFSLTVVMLLLEWLSRRLRGAR